MNTFFTILLVGISLSMDAFSLALIYGMYEIGKKNRVLLSIVVGLFHFLMPLLGLFVGSFLLKFLKMNFRYIVSVIFLFIGIDMIIASIKNKKVDILNNIIGFLLFGFSVSVDSFTAGIGLNYIYSNYLMVSIIFMICSFLFTYLGLILGNKFSIKYGNVSTLVGGFILILLGIYYLFV